MSNLKQFGPKIKSIQNGSGTASRTGTNITISAVDENKSVVTLLGFSGVGVNSSFGYFVHGEAWLVNSTTVRIISKSDSPSETQTIKFQVTEFY